MILLGPDSLDEQWTTVNGGKIFARVSERSEHGNLPPIF